MARRSILTNVWKTVLVTLLSLGLLSACDSAPTEPKAAATPGRPPSLIHRLAWAPVVLADGCPPSHQRLSSPPDGRLPRGANLVRLCNGPSTPRLGAGFRYDMPTDVLTTDVGALIDQVNGLQPPPPPPAGQRGYCADDGGTAITFWFGYPDGTAAAVSWQPFGCRLLHVGPDRAVEGGRDLLAAFGHALAAQREESHAIPSSPRPPHCSPEPQPKSPLGNQDLGELSHVRLCASDNHGWREVDVPTRLVGRINEEIARGQRGRGCVGHGAVGLSAMTRYGDHVVFFVTRHCGWTLPVMPDTGEPWPSWRPSKSLARALDRLLLRHA